MPLSIPPELKKITSFVRRAEELDKDKNNPESRLVSYYCRQFAVHTGIPLATSKEGKACLGVLLGSLEAEKPAMDNFTRDEAKFLCRKFADKVFDKADSEDRAGTANKGTAKTFYAAASFLEILQQFYDDDDTSEEQDEEKKRTVYAKWKATEILKAIKEGRTPTPGGYGESDAGDEEANGEKEDPETPVVETVQEDEEEDDVVPPSAPPAPPVPPPQPPQEDYTNDEGTEVELGPPPAYPGESNSSDDTPLKISFQPPAGPPPAPTPVPPPPLPPPPSAAPQPPPAAPPKKTGGLFGFGAKKPGKVTKAQFADATELTKFALTALEDRNAEVAATRLKQALQALGYS